MSTIRHNDTVQRLRAVLGALAPIDRVSVPDRSPTDSFGVSASVVIAFNVAATQAQRNAANAALASFDWSDAAQEAWEDTTQFLDFATLRSQAAGAVATDDAYLLIADTATNAQVRDQVKALTQHDRQIIKAL